MTKPKILLMGLAAAGMLALWVPAQSIAHGPQHGHGHMRGGGPGGRVIGLLLHATDLTPDQETQAHQILENDRPAVEAIVTQLRQARKDLTALQLAPTVQSDAVTAQLTAIGQLQQQLAQHHVATVSAIRALLSADQIAKAAAAKDQKHDWKGGKHGCDKQA